MFDQRMSTLNAWGADARTKIAQQSKQSTATWKIVNAHYSTHHHFVKYNVKKWFGLLRGSGVHMWPNGHTRRLSLDIHLLENGAGGGFQKDSASGYPSYAACVSVHPTL
ncbi:hypothetical protein PHYSODRAFT_256409 [Phytophthora sojae]|uniref:Uncharacterized protein n=1 Tax=Phytophthora sojae (strain P6497) TaxID=1094619 RepID=G5A375_PHYSP|nr:hypothetical protein PHYSODRAFT_256409 [Phytophthora sojae]EGZ10115.1 hypothetical protein PHYSODRAFT_256409 [Phytophthora sojae]|eukprot:XP_009534976.1 hypothetical protein PHYSODRAFT_256409 [Phytophthora sojae]